MLKNKMKILTVLLMVLSVIITVISLAVLFSSPKVIQGQEVSVQEYKYILKEYNGKLALFNRDSTSPDEIYDIYVSTLPDADRQMLKKGIPIKNDEELLKYIEDFDS